jgi:NitT/TauT family transport system substrate-binding protein
MRVPRATAVAAPAILSALVLMLATACGGSSSPSSGTAKLEKTTLVVGATPAEAVTPLYVAAQQGIFAAHGLNVQIKTIQSTASAQTLPDLLNGTYDIAAGQVTTFISAQASGKGTFRVLASGLELGPDVNQILTMPGYGINNPSDLAGKTIAVNATAGNGELLTDALLATYNIQPKQVHFVPMAFSAMSNALQAHTVDAVYTTEPYLTEMEQRLGASTVADLDQGSAQSLMVGGFTVTAAWAQKNPNTAAAFVASIEQAAELADTSITDVQRAFQVYLDTSPAIADVMATGTFPTSLSSQKLQQVANLMEEFGEINGTFRVQAMLGG